MAPKDAKKCSMSPSVEPLQIQGSTEGGLRRKMTPNCAKMEPTDATIVRICAKMEPKNDKIVPKIVERTGPLGFVERTGPLGFVERTGPLGFVEQTGPLGLVERTGPLGFVERTGPLGRVNDSAMSLTCTARSL